jgi:hypothetical protein
MKTSLASSGDNVTNMTEEQIVARYKAKNPQSYAMGGPDASYEAAQATIKSSQVKMADSGLSISDWAGKYNQNMTSTSASDNGSSILSKGDKIWGEVKDSVWGQMAKDLSGMVRVDFTEPVASVQVGNRNMSFTLMRLRHQAIELGWEFNDCLISAWSYYLACDFQNMETRLAAAESYMAPFNSDEWRKTAAAWDFGQGIMMPGDDTKRDRYDRMLGMKIRRPHLMSMARAAWMAKVGSAADQSVALKHFISGDNFFFRQGDPDITKAQIEDLKEFGNMGIEQYTMQLMEANLAAFIMKEVSSPEYESYVKELIGQSLKYQGQNASIVQAEIKGKISQAFTAPATSLVKFSMVLPLTPMSIPSSECVTPTRVNVGDGASPRQYRRVSVGVF